MTCIKTGCQIYIEPRGEYARCDAFQITKTDGIENNVFVFRIVNSTLSREKMEWEDEVFMTIIDFECWFDKSAQTSTLISSSAYKGELKGKPVHD